MKRRLFIKTIAASTVASQCTANGLFANETSTESNSSSPSWIDAHIHIWTPDLQKYPISRSHKTSEMEPTSFTPEQWMEHAKPQGVSKAVLIQMSFYEFDNSYMLDMIAKYSGVFAGVAIIDENASIANGPSVQSTMKSLASQGVRGFRLYANQANVAKWKDSPGIQTMWNYAAETGQIMCLLADPEVLPSIESMCAKFPQTRVVIDHFARIGMRGDVDEKSLDSLCRLAKFESVYVKTSAFYALGAKKAPYRDLGPMIRRLVNAFGAKRLMWASDCPFQVQDGHTYKDSIALVRDRLEFLSDEDKQWMLRETADKLFFQA